MEALQRNSAAPEIGAQNAHMLSNLGSAKSGAEWLIARGFTVLDINVGAPKPVIVIQNCVACGTLASAMKTRFVTSFGITQVMAAIIEGCQIEWVVNGN